MTTVREPMLVKLRRANLQLAVSILVVAGLALTLIAFWTLRTYVNQNLSLVARSIAYTAQAATVFRDATSAQETLSLIAEQEHLWAVELHDAQGSTLAHYRRADDSSLDGVLSQIGMLILPHSAAADVLHEGSKVGQVNVHGDSSVFVRFFVEVLLAFAVTLGLLMLLHYRLSVRYESDIVRPLDSLAALTRAARIQRAFEVRAPAAQVLEINALSEDFNALLAEIQGHERELLRRQGRLEEANQKLSHQAFHDGLTGLPNRVHFFGRLTNAIEASGPGLAKLAVMYIDCDNFKRINDTLGHAAGDEVLVEFARRLRAKLREGDAVARLGGDEFAIMLTPLRSVDAAWQLAQKITLALAEPIWTQAAGEVATSATVGVAVFPDHGTTMDELLGCADAVMYRAKRKERGICLVANDTDLQVSRKSPREGNE